MIRFSCPTCKNVLQAVDDQAGATVTCPKCNGQMRVPGPVPSKPAAASPPPVVAAPPPPPTAAAPKVVSFSCPSCTTLVRVMAELVGAVVACPKCQLQMKVPSAEPPAEAPPPAPSLPPPAPPPVVAVAPIAVEALPVAASPEAAQEMRNPAYAMFIVAALGLFVSLAAALAPYAATSTRALSALSIFHNLAALALLIMLMRWQQYNLALAAGITATSSWMWLWFAGLTTNPLAWLGMIGAGAVGAWAIVTLRKPAVMACFGRPQSMKPLWSDFLADKRAVWMAAVSAFYFLFLCLMVAGGADGLAIFLFTDVYILGMVGLFFTPFSPAEKLVGKWESKAGGGLPVVVLEFLKDGTVIVERGQSESSPILGSGTRAMHGTYRLVDGKSLEINLDNPGRKLTEKVVSFPNMAKPNQLVLTFEGETRTCWRWNPLAKGLASLFSDSEEKKDHLIGRWEPINGAGAALQFTPDGALIRGDGLIAKFRLRANDVIELYADDAPTTLQLKVMSLSKHELALTADGQGKHYKRSRTFTEEVEKQEADAARESLKKVGKTAAMVAGGAVLALGAAAFLTAAVAAPAYCPCGRLRPCPFHG